MRTGAVLILLFSATALLRAPVSSGKPAESPLLRPFSVIGALHGLRSMDAAERIDTKRELSKYRKDLVHGLMQIAEKAKDNDESRRLAVELLAEFGAKEAIPLCVRHVDYFQPMAVSSPSRLNGYPCAMALADFGQSGTQGILLYLRQNGSDTVSDKAIELYAWVFVAVYGTNDGGHREAVRVVEGATARAFHKERLQRLLDKLKEVTKDRVSVFD